MTLTTSIADIFRSRPVVPSEEIAAYEALWLNHGAWFANLARLFSENPGAAPSELVDEGLIKETCSKLEATLGSEFLSQVGVRLHGAGEYPQRLRDADHPIELLYYMGNWELVDTPCIAIVGTRSPSEEGAFNAGLIAHKLVKQGYTIVSGLAKGIDTCAHNAALLAGGNTIAVIGTPLNSYYPKENQKLQDYIARKHLLISQVPFLRYDAQNYKINRLFFPARNITMSALTSATIIVEAGNSSGTLVQARAALAQNRKLFILDSCFRKPELTWPNKFEKMGAIRVRNVSDLVEMLTDDKADKT
ncbi:DNA-processing protein DprA [Pseudomonas aeruginosa]|nr:DNA-processing protein DprA [Pseudomonas aeruginosa]MCO2516754.1 DNA-processing protein DprA [Pseudomonas aeruginosa]MCO2757383.1 DNA-processing protein DprA [Pseudomonas aeruginosa]MCO2763723.1 DNA-processing protein DprA [Pseudomonas aeruginosa]MCO2771922.1 DNA-processing protein DprA [Pseudomonas aeruginosa]